MAYDTVINKAQLEGAITASANAIREKTGDTALIEWLSDKGFAEAIAAIEAGGGAEVSVGKITPATNVAELTWEHGLSKAPMFVHLFMPIGYSPGSNANLLRTYYKKIHPSVGNDIYEAKDVYATKSSTLNHESSTGVNDVPWIITGTSVTAGSCTFGVASTRNFVSGKPYYWICVAMDDIFPK